MAPRVATKAAAVATARATTKRRSLRDRSLLRAEQALARCLRIGGQSSREWEV